MFRTFRNRLLFWFLVFIGFGVLSILLSSLYLVKRESIQEKTEFIEQAYVHMLKSEKIQQDFFSYETKNPVFFETEQSAYLERYKVQMDSTTAYLDSADFSNEKKLRKRILDIKQEIHQIDSVFLYLTKQVKIRGFKDFSLEGDMRKDAHWLEQTREIPTEKVLSLRRHEKDYIIRNEASYVDKFRELVGDIQKKLKDNQRISQIRKDTILSRLENYEAKFLQMVALDKIIGIKDNTGAKKQLDERIALAESAFGNIVQSAQLWAKKEFNKLTWIYLSLGIALFVFSAFLSALIAKRITQPLTELTEHITQFVDSNFTLETEHPVIRTKDEIGSLTQNFSYLKDEVINRLKFFKQKVDERTAELASANSRLRRLSKANSRFVPDEFLDHLGKKGIEDIQLGDHVEREMTVIFTDIREFTQISESLTPQENFDFINTYLSGIVPIIQKHGGFIDKFIGDSVMALFPKKPDAALVTVLEFYDFLEQFNQIQLEKGRPKIQIGTGIHTGDLILGTIGHKNRLETTVISDAVNTAARIEGLNKYYGANILGTDSTLNKLKHAKKFNYRFLDSVRVKGKTKTVQVYEFLSKRETEKLSYLEDYKAAVELVRNGKIEEATGLFSVLLQQYPKDKAVKIFYERCQNYLQKKGDTWDEVTQMLTK